MKQKYVVQYYYFFIYYYHYYYLQLLPIIIIIIIIIIITFNVVVSARINVAIVNIPNRCWELRTDTDVVAIQVADEISECREALT